MDNDSVKTENFVKTYLKRVLAFKALRQLRVEVDKINDEDAAKKKRVKIIAAIIALLTCFVIFVFYSSDSSKITPTVIDDAGRMSPQIHK
jgi:hypothetical protein